MSKRKICFIFFLFIIFLGSFSLSYFIRKRFFKEPLKIIKPVSFLILGIRGFTPNGDDLTDTILLFFVNPQTKKAAFLSLPRDLWIDSLKTKLNSVYHYGGIVLTKKIISQITGQPIDYFLIVDFDAFGKIVDALGGVTVNVQRSFDDYRFPIPGKENDSCGGDKEYKCRYEHIHFDAGPQTMDGETALKFVRSRNAIGEEGTDFARGFRQQQLLLAIKQKLLSPKVYLSFSKIKNLYQIAQRSLVTDIKPNDYGPLVLLLAQINFQDIHLTILDEKLLTNPKNHYSSQWVLVPKNGNWQEIQSFVKNLIW